MVAGKPDRRWDVRANPAVPGIPGHLAGAAHFSRTPQAGWHVIEATPVAVAARTIGHRSSGTVSLHDPAASMGGRAMRSGSRKKLSRWSDN